MRKTKNILGAITFWGTIIGLGYWIYTTEGLRSVWQVFGLTALICLFFLFLLWLGSEDEEEKKPETIVTTRDVLGQTLQNYNVSEDDIYKILNELEYKS